MAKQSSAKPSTGLQLANPPIARRNMRRVAPTSTFGPTNDIIQEVRNERDKYQGDEQQTIYSCPGYIRTTIDRIRARVEKDETTGLHVGSKPSLILVVACCMHYGISYFQEHDDVKAVLSMKSELDMLGSDDVDPWLVDEIASLFRLFPISVPELSSGGKQQINVKIPLTLKNSIGGLAGELGMSFSMLALLSVMVALSDQPSVFKEHRDTMVGTVEQFLKRVRLRGRVLRAMLDTLKEG